MSNSRGTTLLSPYKKWWIKKEWDGTYVSYSISPYYQPVFGTWNSPTFDNLKEAKKYIDLEADYE